MLEGTKMREGAAHQQAVDGLWVGENYKHNGDYRGTGVSDGWVRERKTKELVGIGRGDGRVSAAGGRADTYAIYLT